MPHVAVSCLPASEVCFCLMGLRPVLLCLCSCSGFLTHLAARTQQVQTLSQKCLLSFSPFPGVQLYVNCEPSRYLPSIPAVLTSVNTVETGHMLSLALNPAVLWPGLHAPSQAIAKIMLGLTQCFFVVLIFS